MAIDGGSAAIGAAVIAAATEAAIASASASGAQNSEYSATFINMSTYSWKQVPDSGSPYHGHWMMTPAAEVPSLFSTMSKEELTHDEEIVKHFQHLDGSARVGPWTHFGLDGDGAGTCALANYECKELGIILSLYLFNPAARDSYRAGVAHGRTEDLKPVIQSPFSNPGVGLDLMRGIETGSLWKYPGAMTASEYSEGTVKQMFVCPHFSISWQPGKHMHFLLRPMEDEELRESREDMASFLLTSKHTKPPQAVIDDIERGIKEIDNVLNARAGTSN